MPTTALAYVGMTRLLRSFPCRRLRIKSAMTAKGVSVVLCIGNAKTRPGWAREPNRHGGEAPALCVETDDVGLDSLVRSYQEERTIKTQP